MNVVSVLLNSAKAARLAEFDRLRAELCCDRILLANSGGGVGGRKALLTKLKIKEKYLRARTILTSTGESINGIHAAPSIFTSLASH
jgi:hypothetical protein